MANDDENLFNAGLGDIGMPPEGEGSIDLDAVLGGDGEGDTPAAEKTDDNPQPTATGGNDDTPADDGLDLEMILNQGASGEENTGDDEDGDGKNTSDEDSSRTPEYDTSSSQDNEEVSPLTPFASLLHEEGVLPHLNLDEISKLESKEDVVNALIEGVKTEINEANNSFINSLPKEFHDMVEAYNEGVPFEFLAQNKRAQLSYDSIEDDKLEEDTELQKKIVTDLMTAKGLKESRIKKLIERSEDLGELFEDAKEAKEELVEALKAQAKNAAEYEKQQRAAAQKQYNEYLQSVKDKVYSADEILPGVKVNKAAKDSAYKNLTEPVAYDESGRPVNYIMHMRSQAKDPDMFDVRLNHLIEITKGLTDFSTINASAETSAAKKFLKNIGNDTSFKSGKHKKAGSSKVTSSMKNLLDSINNKF